MDCSRKQNQAEEIIYLNRKIKRNTAPHTHTHTHTKTHTDTHTHTHTHTQNAPDYSSATAIMLMKV